VFAVNNNLMFRNLKKIKRRTLSKIFDGQVWNAGGAFFPLVRHPRITRKIAVEKAMWIIGFKYRWR